jgi:endonuclease YncB( thermonuclease family)
MIRVLTIGLSLAVFSAVSLAQTGSGIPTDLKKAFKDLKVDVPASCPLVTKAPTHTGGHLPTTKCTPNSFASVSAVQAKVYRVLDGDTIHVYIGAQVYPVRMLGMDTPELHFFGRAQPKWAELAQQSLASMVKAGDTVRLEFDRQKCDKYGRILVHVFKGSTNINREQILRGVASNYCIAPNLKYCNEYADAYANAKSYQRNMHSDKCVVTPYVWRKGLQGKLMDKMVKHRRTGTTYAPMDYVKVKVEDRVFLQTNAQ